METVFNVLYTKHKRKKAKTWNDGTVVWKPENQKLVLYDSPEDDAESRDVKTYALDSIFVRNGKTPSVGDAFEFARFLVEIDSLKNAATSKAEASTTAPNVMPVKKRGLGSRKARASKRPNLLHTSESSPQQPLLKPSKPNLQGRQYVTASVQSSWKGDKSEFSNWAEHGGHLRNFVFLSPIEALLYHSDFQKHCNLQIQKTYPDLESYKKDMRDSLLYELNAMLLDRARQFSKAYLSINECSHDALKKYPLCPDHGYAIERRVMKQGSNHNKAFYCCSKSDCKFFQWKSGGVTERTFHWKPKHVVSRMQDKLRSYRRDGVSYYFGIEVEPMHSGLGSTSTLFIKITSNKEVPSAYSKGDLWVLSNSESFSAQGCTEDQPLCLLVVKSNYFSPATSNGALEVSVLESGCQGQLSDAIENTDYWYGIRCGDARSELALIDNVGRLDVEDAPILYNLYSGKTHLPSNGILSRYSLPASTLDKILVETLEEYQLNEHQRAVLFSCQAWFSGVPGKGSALNLVHGVFGSGKSYLACVLIQFLSKILDASGNRDAKIMVSAITNVAVDRILLGLLEDGYEDIARVGSVRKIAKPVLPYAVHQNEKQPDADEEKSYSNALSELSEMLKEAKRPAERDLIDKAIQDLHSQRRKTNSERIKSARVVGTTCAAASFTILDDFLFPIVILDECSQMIEPCSLMPLGRFHGEAAVIIGDPKQLPPTLQNSQITTLSQTLFDRALLNGVEPHFLATQYRCHPSISRISNVMFYDSTLKDGVTQQQRPSLMKSLPHVQFVHVNGTEKLDPVKKSYFNLVEVNAVVQMLQDLLDAGVPPEEIGIIALYKIQAEKIRVSLDERGMADHGVDVSTVDAFQGAERHVILLSCCRTKHIGFTDNPERVNVAITRAKSHLVVFGAKELLQSNALWKKILAEIGNQSTSTSAVHVGIEENESSEDKSSETDDEIKGEFVSYQSTKAAMDWIEDAEEADILDI